VTVDRRSLATVRNSKAGWRSRGARPVGDVEWAVRVAGREHVSGDEIAILDDQGASLFAANWICLLHLRAPGR
jgi:hypothetical protein